MAHPLLRLDGRRVPHGGFALENLLIDSAVRLHGVLCFVEAAGPLIGGNFTTREVQVLRPGKFYPQLQADGPLTAEVIADVHQALAQNLPPP